MVAISQQFLGFLGDLVRSREILLTMTRRDFSERYLGSCLGFLWAFIHPLIHIAMLWFVFEVGFRSRPVQDFPFILWLSSGMIPWLFFAEAVGRSTGSILERSFLVKKVCFRTSMLPIVSIGSALVIHLFFMAMLLGMYLFYGRTPGLYLLQLPYYLTATIALLLGLAWITSSLSVFLRDVPQIVSVAVQLAFWATPVFWSLEMMPAGFHPYLRLNPVMYVVEGYRDSLMGQAWFWEKPISGIYFWSLSLICFVVGALMFRRLRPHFADVL